MNINQWNPNFRDMQLTTYLTLMRDQARKHGSHLWHYNN